MRQAVPERRVEPAACPEVWGGLAGSFVEASPPRELGEVELMVGALFQFLTDAIRAVDSPLDPDDPRDENICSEDCDRHGGSERCRCYGTDVETTEGGW